MDEHDPACSSCPPRWRRADRCAASKHSRRLQENVDPDIARNGGQRAGHSASPWHDTTGGRISADISWAALRRTNRTSLRLGTSKRRRAGSIGQQANLAAVGWYPGLGLAAEPSNAIWPRPCRERLALPAQSNMPLDQQLIDCRVDSGHYAAPVRCRCACIGRGRENPGHFAWTDGGSRCTAGQDTENDITRCFGATRKMHHDPRCYPDPQKMLQAPTSCYSAGCWRRPSIAQPRLPQRTIRLPRRWANGRRGRREMPR